MALIFQRLARNFIKNGYYPTDGETTQRILNALQPQTSGVIRIFDPCAGEGTALAECKAHLQSQEQSVTAYGIEYDKERAYHAKQILDKVIHGDMQICKISPRSMGLLWLNPPYGDLVADQSTYEHKAGRQRLEKLFLDISYPTLQYGGILVLIIPRYSLDERLAAGLSRHYRDLRVFLAPEQQFKQIVILGIRIRTSESESSVASIKRWVAQGKGELEIAELPEQWTEPMYGIPQARSEAVVFNKLTLDEAQLAEELKRLPSLWDQFDVHFAGHATTHRRPARALSDWHLSLALASGQVSGVVHGVDGQVMAVKGDTFKAKKAKTMVEANEKGEFTETTILLDVFVPVIRAIDLSPTSPHYGEVAIIH